MLDRVLQVQNHDDQGTRSSSSVLSPMSLTGVFSVGSGVVTTLVSLDEVQAHLRILGAFAKLRILVGEAHNARPSTPGLPSSIDEAWVVFLHRAVYRFELWVKSDRRHGNALPPLDVLTVWHGFMLVSPNASVGINLM